jgi:hypothetical protein
MRSFQVVEDLAYKTENFAFVNSLSQPGKRISM